MKFIPRFSASPGSSVVNAVLETAVLVFYETPSRLFLDSILVLKFLLSFG